MSRRPLAALQRTRGPLIGVIAFACVALLLTSLVAGTLMKGVDGETETYTAMFTDTTGLTKGDDVRIAGVAVGTVQDISLDGTHAKVVFDLQSDQQLTTGTTATIDFLNLMGQRYISLESGSVPGSATAEATRVAALKPGSTIGLDHTDTGLDLTALFNAFKPVFDLIQPEDINLLADNLIKTLQGQGPTLRDLTRQVADLTGTLADRDEVIGQVVQNLTTVTTTLDTHRTEITSMVTDLNHLTGTVADNTEQIGATIDGVQSMVTSFSDLVETGGDDVNADVDSLRSWSASFAKQAPALKKALYWTQDLVTGYIKTLGAGSYLNTYVCDSSLQVLGGGPTIPLLKGFPSSARCQR